MEQPRRRGRPRQNLKGDGTGNPIFKIRMPQELLDRVMSKGGSTWARAVLERELALETQTDSAPSL